MSFAVKISGFKTQEQALEFLRWYEGGGEQAFYEHLGCVDKSPKDGCTINVSKKGNTGRYYDIVGNEIHAEVK